MIVDPLGIAVVLLVAVLIVGVLGYGLGILIARRLDRWAATDDEEGRGDHGTDA
jgi:hypothetical protein